MGVPIMPKTVGTLGSVNTVDVVEIQQLENNIVDAYFQGARNEINAVLDETKDNLILATKALRDIVKKYDLNVDRQEVIREDLKYEIHYVINFEGLRERLHGWALKAHLNKIYPQR